MKLNEAILHAVVLLEWLDKHEPGKLSDNERKAATALREQYHQSVERRRRRVARISERQPKAGADDWRGGT